jgi:MATE family multidrug resistance protein
MTDATAPPDVPLPEHLRRTLKLGAPLIGSHLAQTTVGIVDTIMLGWYSVIALAASVLGSMVFFTVFILGSGFSAAALPKVAASQNDAQRVRRITRMTLWLGLGFSVAIYPVFYFSEVLLLAVGQDPEVAAGAQDYLRIAGLGLVPALMVAGLRSHLAGLERTAIVLWATLGAALVNAFLNWVLIFGNLGAPEMGLRGAAFASLSVHTVMAVVLAGYAIRGPAMAQYEVFVRFWRADWAEAREIFVLGWPISLTLLAESGLFMASSLIVGTLGAVALAAHGIALQITSATFMIHMGLAAAITVRTGTVYAQGDGAALRKVAQAGLILSGCAVLVTVTAFFTMPGVLVRGFVDATDPAFPEILALGAVLLMVAGLFQVADAAQVMALGLLRGLQDTRIPMYFALFGYWIIGVPCSYLLCITLGFGPAGAWAGLAVGLSVAGALMTRRFVRHPLVRAG